MKRVFLLAFVAMLGASVLSASEVRAQQNVGGLQSQELEFLFGANANDVNVAVLSEEEMKETQGEFWQYIGYVAAGIGGGVLSGIGEDIWDAIKRGFK